MCMLSLLSSVILISTVGFALAGNICTYTPHSCIRSFGCCYGIAQNTCCYWLGNYGWSVRFQNMHMTSTWLGKVFGNFCSIQTAQAGSSSGSICASIYNGLTYLAWKSGNWNAGTGKHDLETYGNVTCIPPNVIGFTSKDGKEHLVKVPKGKFDEVNKRVKTDNFLKLLELNSV